MDSAPELPCLPQDITLAWEILIAAVRLARHSAPLSQVDFGIDSAGALQPVPAHQAALRWHPERGWTLAAGASAALRALADLYTPLLTAGASRPLAVAHLGQSLDGYIATAWGDSRYVNGPENLLHLHRMRALSDAVLVGAATVATDDPRLTTRMVSGDNPWRVVLDPYGRLPRARRVFNDGVAPTLVVRAADARDANAPRFGNAEILAIPAKNGRLDLSRLLQVLNARGLHVVFVEGGGTTVSAFLQLGLLDRLQVAVAPLVIGHGRPGVRLPSSAKLSDCLRPPCRVHRMGEDALFDCDLRLCRPPATSRTADGSSRHAAKP